MQPSRQLQAVAACYPTSLPLTRFHPDVRILLHLPSSTPFSAPTSNNLRIRLYDAEVGFAERGCPTYNRGAASLAFSRTLSLLRHAIGPYNVDLEGLWDQHMMHVFSTGDVNAAMDGMVSNPHITYVPTLVGGVGYENLYRFYKNYFVGRNPPSLRVTLVSRTVGSDRVVDEIVVKFRHTCEVTWMLPGVAPTGKEVEVAMVTIVCIRGGRLFHQHTYWDQAGVLVQLGLLEKGALPVVGVQSAAKIMDERAVESNLQLEGW